MATPRKTTKKTAGATPRDRRRAGTAAGADTTPRSISETAQQIWLAGVGAFGRAQAEGTRLFDSLVRDGAGLEKTARDFATARASDIRGVVEQGVAQTRDRAMESWERVETLVETRMHGVLQQWGVARREEIEALRAQVDALKTELRARTTGAADRPVSTRSSTAGRKAPVRKTAGAKTAGAAKPGPARPAKARRPRNRTST